MTDTQAPPAAAPAIAAQYRFLIGARERYVADYADRTQAFGTVLDTIDIPAGDFTKGVYLRVDATAAGNAAAVTFAADAPWSAISEVQVLDPQGLPIQILDGYQLYVWNLLGGFTGQTDNAVSPYYSATTGAVAAGGSFSFMLRLPFCLSERDGRGSLYNGSTASQFKVRVVLDASARVYGVAPTAVPQVRVRFQSVGYQLASELPSKTPFLNEPPGGQLYNYLTRQINQASAAGLITIPISRKGAALRQIIGIVRDNSGVRSNSVVSNMVYRADNVDALSGDFGPLRHYTWERSRSPQGSQLPAGVVMWSGAHEWDAVTGQETGDLYTPTSPGSIVEARVTFTAAGSITWLINDVSMTEKARQEGVVKF